MKRLLLIVVLSLLATTTMAASNRILFNGGITIEERATAPEEGTRLVFFVRSGNFLADISVTIVDESGAEVVAINTEGPWLILDLDPGRYQVTAERGNGQVQSLTIEVGTGPQEFGFSFPDEL